MVPLAVWSYMKLLKGLLLFLSLMSMLILLMMESLRTIMSKLSILCCTVQAYICQVGPSEGIVDKQKCDDLGLTRAMLRKLEAGKDVQLKNGKIIESCEIK